jgi:predicted Zn-dependent protease
MRRRTWWIAALALAGCATNPVTGKRELSLVSESQEIEMGRQAAADVRQQMGLVPDSSLQRYVRGIGLELAAGSERPQLPWSFDVIDDASVNAFALPGGFIFVTRGIVTNMTNEAELATVLGHEIGHVTARHSVQQMSRAQLAQLGLGVGSLLSDQVAALSGVLGQGLGLLFLKYSRDDETQADQLGFRYALNDDYDVREMKSMFEMLQRVSASAQGGGSLPQWLSTHPDPENRIAKTDQRLATVTRDLNKAKVNRSGFLQHVDGLVYGTNPRHGYFDGNRFNHPDLAFKIDFPAGWQTENQASAVVGASPQQDAVFALSIPTKDAPTQALTTFAEQQGVQVSGQSNVTINGLSGVSAAFQAQGQNGQALAGNVVFVAYGGSTYQLLGYAAAAGYAGYRSVIQQSVQSFGRLTDPAALAKQPVRIKLVRLSRDMTVDEFVRQYPSAVPAATIALINGVGATTDVLKAGSDAKRVQ